MRANLAARPDDDRREIAVLAENWQAFEVFAACATQWRLVPFGGRCGLDYAALQAVMTLMRIEDVPEAFAKVRVLESAALEVWRQRDEKERLKQQRNRGKR